MVLRFHEDEIENALSQRRCVVQIFITNIQDTIHTDFAALHNFLVQQKRGNLIASK